jgi:L-fucose isomerase-like protein
MPRPTILIKDKVKGLTRKIRESMTFGVVVGNRGFFPAHLAQKGRQDIIKVLEDLGHNIIILSEDDTPFGAVMTYEDARKCANVFKSHAEEIDGIIVTLPNFGDEKAIANALRWANLDVPILIHAEPDTTMKQGERRDSYCGKISVCSNLNQYGIPFSLTTIHTCPINGDTFKEDLKDFTAICRVVNGLRTARIGAIGARPAAFNTVRYSEKLLEISGISVETIDLSEIIGRVKALETNLQVKKRVEAIKSYVNIGDKAPQGSLEKIAKLAIVVEQWIEENDLDAIAFQCWTAIEDYLGVAPCAILSILSNNFIPAACEVDVTGALSMLALELASGSVAAILDWNNNYRDEPDKAVAFHCSNLPATLLENPTLDAHFSESFQAGSGYGTISGRIRPGPFTFARISTDDQAGRLIFYTGEGEFTDDELETFGGYGVMEIPDLQDLIKEICLSGFEHHFAATRGNVAHVIEESFENYLDFLA